MKGPGIWLILGIVVLVGLVLWAGHKWSEAIVQAAAALGGLLYWDYRTRPRVTLRVISSGGLYLELVNVGSRVAKQVELRCNPPIPWEAKFTEPGAEIGPVVCFGDMDRNQRYVIMIRSLSPESADQLENTIFEVSHEDTWGFRRRKSTIQVRGSGWRSSLKEGTATPIGEIADDIKKQEQHLKRIADTIKGEKRQPPGQG